MTPVKTYFMLPFMKKASGKTLLKIRPATEDDIPRILELYRELSMVTTKAEQHSSTSWDDYRRVFTEISGNPRRELLVAEYDGEVVGTVALYIIPNLSHGATPYALVENLIVNHKFRRKGIARKLMEYTIVRAKQQGCHRIELCSSKGRREAHRLYQSVGFKPEAYGFRIWF